MEFCIVKFSRFFKIESLSLYPRRFKYAMLYTSSIYSDSLQDQLFPILKSLITYALLFMNSRVFSSMDFYMCLLELDLDTNVV